MFVMYKNIMEIIYMVYYWHWRNHYDYFRFDL